MIASPPGKSASSLSSSAADTEVDADSAAAAAIGARDAIHILPLQGMPIATPALRRAQLIRNSRLQTMVELFAGAEMGSGQIAIEDVGKEFGWARLPPHPDLILLRKLGELASYDVYSLRILLRESGIAVGEVDVLRLSPAKTAELTAYMTTFTRPLLIEIYGSGAPSFQSFDDLVALFRSPDVKRARDQLAGLARRLGIALGDIPRFLEDYGDIFLSVSYYRDCFDALGPPTGSFLRTLAEIRSTRHLMQDQDLMATCEAMQSTITDLMVRIEGLFAHFERSTHGMWDNLTAERFRALESMIKSYHTTIGGVLCALTVKLSAWTRVFPERQESGLMKRAEFVLLEMRQGFEHIHTMKDRIPLLKAVR